MKTPKSTDPAETVAAYLTYRRDEVSNATLNATDIDYNILFAGVKIVKFDLPWTLIRTIWPLFENGAGKMVI